MITSKTMFDFVAHPTRSQYQFLFIAISSLGLFFSILYVPFLAPLLWEMTFVKFFGGLMMSGFASLFSASIGHLLFTLNDETNNAKTKTTTHYQNFYEISLLKWTSIIFLSLLSTFSLISYFLITTPVVIPTAMIALTFMAIVSLMVGAMLVANSYWKLFEYQPKQEPIIQNVQTVQNIQNVTTHEHHYQNELTAEQKKSLAELATKEATKAAREAAEATLKKERQKAANVHSNPINAGKSESEQIPTVVPRHIEQEKVKVGCC